MRCATHPEIYEAKKEDEIRIYEAKKKEEHKSFPIVIMMIAIMMTDS